MIEFLGDAGVAPNSIDLAISNCVINLSPNKEKVLQGVYDSLREGGEFYFSDVYCDRRLPQAVREHDVMLGECLGGALYVEDFRRICAKVGFLDVRELTRETITVNDPELEALCGQAEFVSITYRCFKLKEMETLCEDYGQVAYYKGTIADHPHTYKLDDHHIFEKNRWVGYQHHQDHPPPLARMCTHTVPRYFRYLPFPVCPLNPSPAPARPSGRCWYAATRRPCAGSLGSRPTSRWSAT